MSITCTSCLTTLEHVEIVASATIEGIYSVSAEVAVAELEGEVPDNVTRDYRNGRILSEFRLNDIYECLDKNIGHRDLEIDGEDVQVYCPHCQTELPGSAIGREDPE